VLAIAADSRDPAIEAPTLAEIGYPVDWRGFGGIWAPRGLPVALRQRLEAACLEATRSAAYGSVMASAAQVVAPLDAQQFGARLAAKQCEAHALPDRLGPLVQ
jgi:tripartite-type tricarboxylate transporter receptor subunit TctC